MASVVDETVLREVQTSNRFILKRLTEIAKQETTCSCRCHSKDQESALELEYLKQRHKSLEDRAYEQDEEVHSLKSKLNTLKEKLDTRLGSQIAEQSNFGGDILPSSTEEVDRGQNDKILGAGELNDSDLEVAAAVKPVEIDRRDGAVELDKPETEVKDLTLEEGDKPSVDTSLSNESPSPSEVVKDIKVEDKPGTGTETHIADDKREGNTDSSVNFTKGKKRSDAVTYRKPTAKANFRKKSLSESLGVKVVEQTEKRTINFAEWHMKASAEETQGRMSGLATLRGLFTVVCVDISYSMTKGNAWEQARKFFTDLIESLKHSMNRYNLTEESVALITFGHKTEVLKRLTNDFSSLQMSFDGISLGGPSPMYGGLLMCAAAAQSTMCGRGANVNGIQVSTKCVIITDGNPTDTNLVAGPDELTPTKQDDTNSQILEVMQKMEGGFDVFCVPVGNANMEFLELMVSVSDGKLITYKDGEKIGSRLRKTVIAGGGMPFRPDNDDDDEDIKGILEDAARRSKHRRSLNYKEIDTDQLPQIGSRVRRGPDWIYNVQDKNGPGTVIGHASNDQQIWVEWDNTNNANIYRYSMSEGYDVLITDEARQPESNGRLAVGCLVKPGKDWQHTTRNVNATDRGVVIKTPREGLVQVRWSNKERGDYSYGLTGRTEVEFCPSEVPFPTGSNMFSSGSYGAQEYVPRLQLSAAAQSRAVEPNRNKNKNVVNKNKNVVNKNKNVANKNKND